MSDLIKTAVDTFNFNSLFVELALGDLSQEHGLHRMKDGKGSSILYLAGHLASLRNDVLKLAGVSADDAYSAFRDGGPDDGDDPDVAKVREDWKALAGKLGEALAGLSDEQVLAEPPNPYPVEDKTVRGALTFLSWHETYHVGQAGLIRTELAYPSLQSRFYEFMKGS